MRRIAIAAVRTPIMVALLLACMLSLGGSLQSGQVAQAAVPQASFAIDADPSNGTGPCNPVDAAATIASGPALIPVALCLEQAQLPPVYGGFSAIELRVAYTGFNATNVASDLIFDVNGNPDWNEEGLSGPQSWDCNDFGAPSASPSPAKMICRTNSFGNQPVTGNVLLATLRLNRPPVPGSAVLSWEYLTTILPAGSAEAMCGALQIVCSGATIDVTSGCSITPYDADNDGDGVANLAEFNGGTDLCNADTDGDGYKDKAATTQAFTNPNTSEDNCPANSNPGQENTDGGIGNGNGLAPDVSVPVSDAVGDACDLDDDNDGIADAGDNEPLSGELPAGCGYFAGSSDGHADPARGDVTYDDNGDGNAAPPYGTDTADDGPSWDTDGDGVRDGAECALGDNPRNPLDVPSLAFCGGTTDADGDGLPAGLETCRWGTSDSNVDSDGDGLGDCAEVHDVNGNSFVSASDATIVKRAVFGLMGMDGNFDINGNGIVNASDATLILRGVFGIDPCL